MGSKLNTTINAKPMLMDQVWSPFGKIPKHTFYSNQIASDTRLHVDYRHAVGCRDAVERWMPGTVKLKMTGDWSVPSR
ncbi:hypothetical protein QO009_003270 [Brevibacillus aydinogluensis]|jgi:hypothetical protein|uniref:hypothetical protein n=2 Tax=Brevibacillus TaxID=55080 RepID=UPI001B992097|nr:hypothetical protein [Brevibacillus aydinogluensis]MBR8661205.1 hypothetical protein [Brevibacillus sp. NL20B1]MDT3417375.1 hypothetical protein [Brevibacillus aydinogluensis]